MSEIRKRYIDIDNDRRAKGYRMEELGMTQRALAEKMNCTQQYVSKVLKGRENLSLETLCKIENALGIKILQAGINK